MFSEGERDPPSTLGPTRCRGVAKAANSPRRGRRPVRATHRFLNGPGALDHCLNHGRRVLEAIQRSIVVLRLPAG